MTASSFGNPQRASDVDSYGNHTQKVIVSGGTFTAPSTITLAGTVSNVGTLGTVTNVGTLAAITGTVAENLSQVGGTGITLGQKVAASSIPVVIASDDTVAVSGTLGSVTNVGTLGMITNPVSFQKTVQAPHSQVINVATSAYAVGNVIGGLQSLDASAQTKGRLTYTVCETALDIALATNMRVLWFSGNPSNSTITDRSNFVFSALDLPNFIGANSALAMTALGNASGSTGGNNFDFVTNSGTLYYCLVAESAFTPSTTGNVSVNIILAGN